MRYEPVRVCNITRVEYKKLEPGEKPAERSDGIPRTHRRKDGLYGLTGAEKRFWQVHSKLLGTCGHEHRTEKAAQPCFRRMQKKWSQQRSEKAKRQHAIQRTGSR
jgi:hypothetical protein